MFKELAIKRITDGASISVVVKELGIGEQTLRNWVKAAAGGKLNIEGASIGLTSTEQITTMEYCWLQRHATTHRHLAPCTCIIEWTVASV